MTMFDHKTQDDVINMPSIRVCTAIFYPELIKLDATCGMRACLAV